MHNRDLHPVRITGEIALSDNSTTHFRIFDNATGGGTTEWLQWGNGNDKMTMTVELVEAFTTAAEQRGLKEEEQSDDERGQSEERLIQVLVDGEQVRCEECGAPLAANPVPGSWVHDPEGPRRQCLRPR